MDSLYVAFHKGSRGTFFSWLICKWTHSPYSHSELVFVYKGQASASYCFSSDEKDGGTRFKQIVLDPADWDLIEIPCTDEEWHAAISYAKSKNGLKYDKLGILGIATGTGDHDDKDRFCSEICCETIQEVFGWEPHVMPWVVSPGDLYTMLKLNPIKAVA